VFEISDGRTDWDPSRGADVGLLLAHTSLTALLHHAGRGYVVDVDSDSVEGLSDDAVGLEFLVMKLGFKIVLSHHPGVAARVAELGGLSFMQVFALDSTGLRRSLESHPPGERIGSAVSPGLVLPHLGADELAQLPRPILAYGLVERPVDIVACLRCADSIVLTRDALVHVMTSESLAVFTAERAS
jgi:glycerol-3-phosphate responsive antiterminator